MSEIIPKNFKFCELSLYLAYKSLLEISNILFYKSVDLSPISRSDTFRFYLFTLHYTFILEFTKLMEKDDEKRKDNHFASLQKISKKIYNIKGKDFKDLFQDNSTKLELIWESQIFKKIQTLRDSKIAHIDNCKKVKPFDFEPFSIEEIEDLFKIIENIKIILNNCLSMYDREYFLPSFSRTSNLLTYFEEYRAFAHSKPLEFWEWKNKK